VSRLQRPFSLAEKLLLAVIPLGLLHHLDHVLRGDHSGWPFESDLTPFTPTLLVYAFDISVLLARARPWYRVGVLSADVALVLLTHLFVETPNRLFGTWANNASSAAHALGEPNRLGMESPLLGVVSLVVVTLLLIGLVATWAAFLREAMEQRAERVSAGDPAGLAAAAKRPQVP